MGFFGFGVDAVHRAAFAVGFFGSGQGDRLDVGDLVTMAGGVALGGLGGGFQVLTATIRPDRVDAVDAGGDLIGSFKVFQGGSFLPGLSPGAGL